MARRFAARGRAVVAPRRQTRWFGPADQGYVAVATTAQVLVASLPIDLTSLVRPTITRTRGLISIKPELFSADVDIVGCFGAGVVSQEAFDIGITAIPGPFDDADWSGWYVWQPFAFHFEETAGSSGLWSVELPIDSKAMRKVGPNEVLVFVAESQVGAFRIALPLRTLFKLS